MEGCELFEEISLHPILASAMIEVPVVLRRVLGNLRYICLVPLQAVEIWDTRSLPCVVVETGETGEETTAGVCGFPCKNNAKTTDPQILAGRFTFGLAVCHSLTGKERPAFSLATKSRENGKEETKPKLQWGIH